MKNIAGGTDLPWATRSKSARRCISGRSTRSFVTVQAYYGEDGEQRDPHATHDRSGAGNKLERRPLSVSLARFAATESGSYGLNVRVIPTHPHLTQAHELRLITWANSDRRPEELPGALEPSGSGAARP